MVIVVPALAHGEQPKDEVVPAFVAARIRSSAPQVAERIDAPGNMVNEEDANEPAPDQTEQKPIHVP